jgi:uncharacterized Fe-S center protein
MNNDVLFTQAGGTIEDNLNALQSLLNKMKVPYQRGDSIAVKLHWGERGNTSFLSPHYAREIVQWLVRKNVKPFIFDTTVLYSGGRRTGSDSIETAKEHGYTEAFLGCPIVIGDGMDGRDIVDIDAGFKHFKTVQVTPLVNTADGFFIFSHFKGHLEAGFGGAIKNISMGFASRAQKQRMHADAHPVLNEGKCSRCGICVEVCPTGAAEFPDNDTYPEYDLDLCIGCAQCIALCPELALKTFWSTDITVFQEKLVETAAAVWKQIRKKTLLVNSLLNITADCDCLPGKNPTIAKDLGFLGAYHPVVIDKESIKRIGEDPFNRTHPGIPWARQFTYAGEIEFVTDTVG